MLSIAESDLAPLTCSPQYFSWSDSRYEAVNPETNEAFPLEDPQIRSYLANVTRSDPGSDIFSIRVCERPEDNALIFLGVGPCGGGCSGIPTLVEIDEDGTLTTLASIQPDGDGAYFSCHPLQLGMNGDLFVRCAGEGTEIIRLVSIASGSVSIVLRCQLLPDGPTCTRD